MAEQIIKMEQFQDIPIRCVSDDGKQMIPVVDIANAVQMDRGNLTKLLNHHSRFFDEYKGVVKTTTAGGVQSLVCLTRDGVMGLLFKVNPGRSKDPEIQDRIIAFQHWATRVLGKNALMEEAEQLMAIPSPMFQESPIDIISQELDIADLAIERSGLPKDIAHALAWTLAAERTGKELNAYASCIKAQAAGPQISSEVTPAEKAQYDSYFSKTKVADAIGISTDKLFLILESMNLLCYKDGIWRVTPSGESYAKMFLIQPGYPYNTYKKAFIRFHPSVIPMLRKHQEAKIG
jgi:hypothetical protein